MLLLLLLSLGPGSLWAAPASREVYRMPPSALRALSDRGTVVLEAALTAALSSLDRASSEQRRADAGCRGCVPCLFQNCGERSGSCSPPSLALMEPSCDVISKAQKLEGEAERSWALSQACAFYQSRCPVGQVDTNNCIRIMGESCSARVLQCSLLNTMQNLEPAVQTHTQAVCGQRSSTVPNITQPRSRIVGGSPAAPGSWPWLVNLQLDRAMMCGGVLVDSSWVVTAAHCFRSSHDESSWTAVVGEFDIKKTDPDEQVLKVNRIIPHPKFNPKTLNNDIALVELTNPVVMSDHVTPVCLPSGSEPPAGSPCLVAGWGSLYEEGPFADAVMEAKVPLLSQSTCKSIFGKELVVNTMLCAGYLSGGVDSCQGDSGGPLLYQDRLSGRFQLHGIISWGNGCGEKGKPGVYTRVSTFSDWIQAEIQKSVGSREPTCPELLKTTEMTEEVQRSEFSSLCHFYTLTCPPGQPAGACGHMAEEKCLSRFKKCQLHSFLQTLLDLLQRAEDYIRDKVDLTFFTQTLPQLVEHIYSTALTHSRERRGLGAQIKEQLGGPTGASPRLPTLFREVGPSVGDWEGYLKNIAEDLEEQHADASSTAATLEDNIFLQGPDFSVQKLEGDYQSIISALLSKLDSRAAPPILHLDPVEVQGDTLKSTPASSRPPGQSELSSSSQTSRESWSLLTTLIEELHRLRTVDPDPQVAPQSNSPSSQDSLPHPTWMATSEDVTEEGDQQELGPSELRLVVRSTAESGHTETADAKHRNQRSLQHDRQTTGGKICPGVKESSQQVTQVRDSYGWILNVPSRNVQMTFQEVLVDLSSKNERGLYQARVRAVVGGRPFAFYSLVGLENESFYRSMPRIIASALEALKS